MNQIETPANFLDDINTNGSNIFPNKLKIFTVCAIALLLFLNTYLAYKISPILARYQTYNERKSFTIGAVAIIYFVLPLSAFVLSLLTSLIPYKNSTYSKKYIVFSLITLIIFQTILFMLFLIIYAYK